MGQAECTEESSQPLTQKQVDDAMKVYAQLPQ
jgi:hypothetical protein